MTNRTQEFLDVRKHGFFRVAAVLPRVHLSNPSANAEEHIRVLTEAYAQGASYAVAPELGLTGYSNKVLFHQDILPRSAEEALTELVRWSKGRNMLFSVGLPLKRRGKLFNTAVSICNGRILRVTPKTFLAEGHEFDEEHFFVRASGADFDEVTIAGQTAPFGNNILIECAQFPDVVIHDAICEDDWVPIGPGTIAAANGATVAGNLSGSDYSVDKELFRQSMFAILTALHLKGQVYCSAGYGESTTDLVWDGHRIIANRGVMLHSSLQHDNPVVSVVADLDILALTQDRMTQKSFAQFSEMYRTPMRRVVCGDMVQGHHAGVHDVLKLEISPTPFVPNDPERRTQRCAHVLRSQAQGLMRRVEMLPPDKRNMWIGISGGLDSCLALLVAIRAADLLGLPRSNVKGVMMPGMGTDSRTRENAEKLVRALGAEYRSISIEEVTRLQFKMVGYDPDADGDVKQLIFENGQAWERMKLLLALSCFEGGLVVGTGDLSERAVGWCTFLADHAGHYGVNAGVPKTLVGHVVEWIADVLFAKDETVRTTIHDILATPPTPGLQPIGKSGVIRQKTDEIIGPLELRDFYLYYLGRFGFSPSRIARMALHAFASRTDGGAKYDIGLIKYRLDDFIKRFFRNQFKRSMSLDGPRIGWSDSPRVEFRMPSDAQAEAWLRDLDKVPDQI